MLRKMIFSVVLTLSICNVALAQDKVPTLKGKMSVSVTKGTVKCDFTLSNIPRIKDYMIFINTGMNIRYFRNTEDTYNYVYEKKYNDTLSDECFGYYFNDSTGKNKFLPQSLQISYVGRFPVMDDTMKASETGDWKGNIAFNGYSVRADGRQSGWYPVLYDVKNDKWFYELKYDIEINCNDCNTLYLNGNTPVQATMGQFHSETPVEMMLYAGEFKIFNVDGTYFLNPDITEEQMKKFGTMTNKYKNFFESKLDIPYLNKITYIQTTPVTTGNAWLFVSYPTIVNIGHGNYGMKGFFNKKTGNWLKPFIAHELAHYYFGSYAKFNSELGDMLSEGFAEFLSLQVSRELLHDSIYTAKINEKIVTLKNFQATPFSKVKKVTDYQRRDMYVYNYAPIIFTAIEKEISIDSMWVWLRSILVTKTDFTNYDFLIKTLSSTLKDDAKLQGIKERYFESDAAMDNAIETILKQPADKITEKN